MSNNACSCNWPKSSNGGPNPSRTWFRGSLNCSGRFNLSLNEINMRRKAEVLQHKQNQLGMSKAQKWSYIVNNKSTNINPQYMPYGLELNNNVYSCKNAKNPSAQSPCNRVICSSSQASDVPGTETTLYLDPTVPVIPLRTNPQQTNAGGQNIPVNILNCQGNTTPI